MATPPRHYFLNEQHEFTHGEKDGGGRLPKFGKIDWKAKGSRIAQSLISARRVFGELPDPVAKEHFFLLATAVDGIPKESAKGAHTRVPSFAGEDAFVFQRLGLDLVDVVQPREAIVHINANGIGRLIQTTDALGRESSREQARWATLDGFAQVAKGLKVDGEWLASFTNHSVEECVIKLHPLLSRLDVERVMRTIAERFKRPLEQITRVGRTFSGRPWVVARLARATIEYIADGFPSVRAIHPVLLTAVDAAKKKRPAGVSVPFSTVPNLGALPAVAIVDGGVPSDHLFLKPYMRGQFVGAQSARASQTSHGSQVASRAVFGEVDFYGGLSAPPVGKVAFVDVAVADPVHSTSGKVRLRDEDVIPTMLNVRGASPDVRVFNLSFSGQRPDELGGVDQRERFVQAAELDNFVFQQDVLVVMSAGNSPVGAPPVKAYPEHVSDARWQMGIWASGVNTLKCGAYVGHPVETGIVSQKGWPSPFSKIGPPATGADSPEFAATGGDLDSNYNETPGAGVWCCDETNAWTDVPGTSFSAPIVARQAALTMQALGAAAGSRPFAVLVRAFMSITARLPAAYPNHMEDFVRRTLGRGVPSSSAVSKLQNERAFIFWQGVLNGPEDIARVQLPIPGGWLSTAEFPRVRIVACWDPPVNYAAYERWICREVSLRLKVDTSSDALHGSRAKHPNNSPVIDRVYDLSADKLAKLGDKGIFVSSDFWDVELSYEQIAPDPLGVAVSPVQRVAFVAELYDESESPVSPHEAIQALPASKLMTQLSKPQLPLAATLLVAIKS